MIYMQIISLNIQYFQCNQLSERRTENHFAVICIKAILAVSPQFAIYISTLKHLKCPLKMDIWSLTQNPNFFVFHKSYPIRDFRFKLSTDRWLHSKKAQISFIMNYQTFENQYCQLTGPISMIVSFCCYIILFIKKSYSWVTLCYLSYHWLWLQAF